MQESFDAVRYLRYVASQWMTIGVACLVALLLALGVSLMLTKRYTSTASILIEPPAGSDPRTLTAVSPVYLESLRTYEMFASSDSQFLNALEKFGLRAANQGVPIESLKRRILKVSKLRDTKLLQISVTLPDANQAHAMAQFLAEETIRLSESVNRETSQDILDDAQKQLDAAAERLKKAQSALEDYNGREPLEASRSELEAASELRMSVQRELVETEAQIAELGAGGKARTPSNLQPEPESATQRAAELRARAELLSRQAEQLRKRIEAISRDLGRRGTGREALEAANKAAQSSFDAAVARLRDVRASGAYAGERLKVVDTGIVPQRPTSPNVGLNCAIALALAFLASLAYVSVRFSLAL